MKLRQAHQHRAVRRVDDAVERALDHWRGRPVLDRVLYAASEAGNFSLLWHAAAWAPWLVAPSPQRRWRAVRTSALLGLEAVIVNGPVKAAFRRERPILEEILHPHRLRAPRTSSFPSGHASAAMAAAALLGRGRPVVAAGAYGAAAVVAVSRVYVRIHHASDVIGGVAVGWVLGRVLRRVPFPGAAVRGDDGRGCEPGPGGTGEPRAPGRPHQRGSARPAPG